MALALLRLPTSMTPRCQHLVRALCLAGLVLTAASPQASAGRQKRVMRLVISKGTPQTQLKGARRVSGKPSRLTTLWKRSIQLHLGNGVRPGKVFVAEPGGRGQKPKDLVSHSLRPQGKRAAKALLLVDGDAPDIFDPAETSAEDLRQDYPDSLILTANWGFKADNNWYGSLDLRGQGLHVVNKETADNGVQSWMVGDADDERQELGPEFQTFEVPIIGTGEILRFRANLTLK